MAMNVTKQVCLQQKVANLILLFKHGQRMLVQNLQLD